MRRAGAFPYAIASAAWIIAHPAAAADDAVAKAQSLDKKHNTSAAAEAWEKAFESTKTPKHLFKAARDYQKSNNPARAANDYARYLAAAPESERKDRTTAKKELATLGAKLGRFAVRATGSTKIVIDAEVIDLSRAEDVYVMPGPHTITATFETGTAKEQATAVAGQSVPVVVAAPAEGEGPAPPVEPVAENKPASTPSKSGDKFSLPPLAVYIGGGLTGILGGLTLLSALDVASQKSTFDKDKSQANLDEGKSKQTRTNILLGATAGFAVLTGITAIVLVDWKRTDTKLGFGPGSVFISRTF